VIWVLGNCQLLKAKLFGLRRIITLWEPNARRQTLLCGFPGWRSEQTKF